MPPERRQGRDFRIPRPRDYSDASVLAHAADSIRTFTWLTAALHLVVIGLTFLASDSPAEPVDAAIFGVLHVGALALLTAGVRRGWTVAWVLAVTEFAGGLAGTVIVFDQTGWYLFLLPGLLFASGLARMLSRDVLRIFFRRPLRHTQVVEEAWQPPFALLTPVVEAPPAPTPPASFDYFG